VSGLRKYMRQALGKFLNIKKKVEKADGLKIEEMFDKRMTKCGREALQENIHNLKAENIRGLHAETCEACQARQACYIDRMVDIIRWGWRPDVGEMTDMHAIGKNGKNARERFNRKFEEEVTKAVNKGYLRQNPDGEMTPGQWHPLNMAVKPSDKMAAKIHTRPSIIWLFLLTSCVVFLSHIFFVRPVDCPYDIVLVLPHALVIHPVVASAELLISCLRFANSSVVFFRVFSSCLFSLLLCCSSLSLLPFFWFVPVGIADFILVKFCYVWGL